MKVARQLLRLNRELALAVSCEKVLPALCATRLEIVFYEWFAKKELGEDRNKALCDRDVRKELKENFAQIPMAEKVNVFMALRPH